MADTVIRARMVVQKGTTLNPLGERLAVTPSGTLGCLVGAPTMALHRAALHRVLLTDAISFRGGQRLKVSPSLSVPTPGPPAMSKRL